ncbi:MAG: beta-ketoacyl-ACP synthase [Hyphomicrobiales bacterium]|nr:beta-ketoacyl-ACP synthase [Hyphomicrobiales bacterium]
MHSNDVLITGIGLVSSLGEGADVHWRKLTAAHPQPVIEDQRFAPYVIHPLPAIDWGLQIPKRGDQRQMETWQRLGTYAAGLALDDAGLKADDGYGATMDMVVAAGGGERDEAVDSAILEASATRGDFDVLLNEKLTTELRPTLFLAQLSNLLAGNVSIVHKVTGSSRTFMGEEGAGVAAIQTAAARIRSGQSSHMLVGSAFQTEHHDMLLGYELAGYLHRGPWKPVWQRQGSEGGGVISGSGGAFLVLESREHVEKRGGKAYAQLGAVVSERIRRRKQDLAAEIATLAAKAGVTSSRPMLAVSGASGAHAATAAEKLAFAAMPDVALRGFGSLVGHLKEAQFPFAVALAALAVQHRAPYPPFDATSETRFDGDTSAVLATTVGYHQFEGFARIIAAN